MRCYIAQLSTLLTSLSWCYSTPVFCGKRRPDLCARLLKTAYIKRLQYLLMINAGPCFRTLSYKPRPVYSNSPFGAKCGNSNSLQNVLRKKDCSSAVIVLSEMRSQALPPVYSNWMTLQRQPRLILLYTSVRLPITRAPCLGIRTERWQFIKKLSPAPCERAALPIMS